MSNSDTLLCIKKKMQEIMPKGSEAILFGSRARGDYHEGSDWDILILLDKENINFLEDGDISYSLRELGWDIDEEINAITYTKKNWEAGKHRSLLYHNIQDDGIKIWG